MNRLLSLALPLAGIMSARMPAHAAFPPLRLELTVESQLQSPTVICNAGDGSGRLFIAEQRGQIRILRDGVLRPAPFLDLSALLVPERSGFDERGLLGLCFHPQYGQAGQPGAGRFYVVYSAPSPNAPGTAAAPVDCRTVLAEYRVSAGDVDAADPASARILLTFDKPQFNHNGGDLAYGPDGFLYFATGDGGSSNDNNAGHTGGSSSRPTNALGNSQDLTRLLGKILRIDPLGTDGPGGQYGIPATNPFAAAANGERPEIFAFGLRNPWKIAFDTGPGGTGRLFAADVGQNQVEEIDLIQAGGNYGWRNKEGTFVPSFSTNAPPLAGTVVYPIAQYAHPGVVLGSPALPQIGISVTGGRVYRGSAIPGLAGKYVFGDWSTSFNTPAGTLLGLEENAGVWSLSVLDIEGGNPIGWFIQAFGADEQGELYVGVKKTLPVSAQLDGLPAGALYKLAAVPAPVTVTVEALKDNTLFSNRDLSNGKGEYLFSGRTLEDDTTSLISIRRALLKFDLSSVPAHAQVQTARVSLVLNKTIAGNIPMRLHRATAPWGEGTSNAAGNEGDGTTATNGDATWTRRIFSTVPANAVPWTTPGGDFDPVASATAVVGNPPASTRYFWSGARLNADLTAALADPSAHEGWILIGDETFKPTAKRFLSRETPVAANRPKLELTYLPGSPPLSRRQQWVAEHYFAGEFVDDAADTDGDRLPSLLEYAFAQDPKAADTPADGFRIDARARVHFLRDTRATDLTYTLRGAGDLPFDLPGVDVARSAGGAAVTGIAPVTETVSATNPALREVTVDLSAGDVRFVRLEILRN